MWTIQKSRMFGRKASKHDVAAHQVLASGSRVVTFRRLVPSSDRPSLDRPAAIGPPLLTCRDRWTPPAVRQRTSPRAPPTATLHVVNSARPHTPPPSPSTATSPPPLPSKAQNVGRLAVEGRKVMGSLDLEFGQESSPFPLDQSTADCCPSSGPIRAVVVHQCSG